MKNQLDSIYRQELAKANLEARTGNKNAQAALSAYNERCEREKRMTREHVDSCMEIGMSKMESFASAIRAGLGPKIYNPPLSARVRFIVT